ncbi:MAG: HEAT repeat domain-containing protein, partial [Planctomycetota bacterium]
MRPLARWMPLVVFGALVAAPPGAGAYPVGPPVPLEEMGARADLIVKATVRSVEAAENDWFRPYHGYEVRGARLRVVSVVKGEVHGEEIVFLHYAPGAQAGIVPPQHYELDVGRTYLFLAANTGTPGIFRQLWISHTVKEDQGVFRAADPRPHRGVTLEDVVWEELGRLLAASDPADVVYAIDQLDEMSAPDWDARPRRSLALQDFDREAVLAAIAPHAESPAQEVALRAIEALGSRNPYLRPAYAPHWLAAFGAGNFGGYRMDVARTNVGGRLYAALLSEIASGDASAEIRALAIRALGRSMRPPDPEALNHWARDPEPTVRQAALILSADASPDVALPLIWTGAHDDDAPARAGAARAVGFGRFEGALDVLAALLDDGDPAVRRAAAMSLLSFSAETARTHFEAALDHPEFGVLFV